ncbi:MAG: hypothetical protein ACRDN9_21410 [Streptosporangiaceae bacterium]
MDEVLFGVLADAVAEYLDAIEREPSAQETHRMVAAWRALLRLHRATGRGCAGCRGRRGAFCGVWRVAVGYFVHRRPGERES